MTTPDANAIKIWNDFKAGIAEVEAMYDEGFVLSWGNGVFVGFNPDYTDPTKAFYAAGLKGAHVFGANESYPAMFNGHNEQATLIHMSQAKKLAVGQFEYGLSAIRSCYHIAHGVTLPGGNP